MKAGRPLWDEAVSGRRVAASAPPPHADVAVIGGGLAGLSTAHHLLARQPGLSVAVIEAAHIGAGASGRNTGMVGPGVGQSLESLVRRLGEERAAALYRATLEAVRTTVSLVEREKLECDLERTGQILVARSRADRRRLRRQAERMAALDLPHEVLDDHALQARLRLEPAAGTDEAGPTALLLPEAALVHPGKLVAGLATRVVQQGGVLAEGWRVRRLEGGGAGQAVGLDLEESAGTGTRRLTARRAVVATAGYTPSLGLLRGRVLPVHLQALATAPLPPEALAHLGWRGREGIVEARRLFSYFRLTADHRLVFGGGAPRFSLGGGSEGASEERALARLHAELRRRFRSVPGMAELPITHAWTGRIGYVLDALPAIGPRRGQPEVVQLLGWCGHGLALAVAAGAWVAAGLTGGLDGIPKDLAWFRDRPPLLPFAPLRWLAFRAAVTGMALLDRRP